MTTTITKEEIERLRALYEREEATECLMLLDALAAAEARAEAAERERDKSIAQWVRDHAAMRFRAEEAERERDEALIADEHKRAHMDQIIINMCHEAGCFPASAPDDVALVQRAIRPLRERAEKAEAACAVMRGALGDNVLAWAEAWLRELRCQGLDTAQREASIARIYAALATDAGKALLEERDRLRAAVREYSEAVQEYLDADGSTNRDRLRAALSTGSAEEPKR